MSRYRYSYTSTSYICIITLLLLLPESIQLVRGSSRDRRQSRHGLGKRKYSIAYNSNPNVKDALKRAFTHDQDGTGDRAGSRTTGSNDTGSSTGSTSKIAVEEDIDRRAADQYYQANANANANDEQAQA